jgi:hypothetical protein
MYVTIFCVCLTVASFKYILSVLSHLQQGWEKFVENWLNCKYEVHFNNVKLDNISRTQDNSNHDRKEMMKYIKRIYRSQSPEKRTKSRQCAGTSRRRLSDVFVATPPSKVFIRRTSSAETPVQLSQLQWLSEKQISFDGLRLSPTCSSPGDTDYTKNIFASVDSGPTESFGAMEKSFGCCNL